MNAKINAILNKHAQEGDVECVDKLLREMLEKKLSPDVITMSTVINAHAQAGDEKGADKWLCVMRDEMHLSPDEITMNTMLKANNKSPKFSWSRLIEYYSFFGEGILTANKFTYGQLLLACKKTRKCTQAITWFDDLLRAHIEPTEWLCGVLRDILGDEKFEEYRLPRKALFEAAALSSTSSSRKIFDGNGRGGGGGGRGGGREGSSRVRRADGSRLGSQATVAAASAVSSGGGGGVGGGGRKEQGLGLAAGAAARVAAEAGSRGRGMGMGGGRERQQQQQQQWHTGNNGLSSSACRFFFQTGTCRFGSSCRFSHSSSS